MYFTIDLQSSLALTLDSIAMWCDRAHPLRALFVLFLVTLGGPSVCLPQSNTAIPDMWVTDDGIRAMVSDGSTLYIGGFFSALSPRTGSFVGLDATTGDVVTSWPIVDGYVSAIAQDGSGGWILGGSFSEVGGVARAGLARILPDGRLALWDPSPNGSVDAVAVIGHQVFVGGRFTEIAGVSRARIAALDLAGNVLQWDPSADEWVSDMVVVGSTMYVGGTFTSIGGQPRNRLAALDTATGLATPWDPDASGTVMSLAIGDGVVIAGGYFTTMGGQPRNRIAAIDPTTGLPTSWDPAADGTVTKIATDGSTVYAGGTFHNIGGAARTFLAAIDADTGLATAWNPPTDSAPFAIRLDGSTVYVGGGFGTVNGQERRYIAALDVATGALKDWWPLLCGGVNDIEVASGVIYAAGTFSGAGGVIRRRLAAIDLATGQPTSWDPNLDGVDVLTLAIDGSTLFVGGNFESVDSVPRSNLASFDMTTGSLNVWAPDPDNIVWRVEPSGGSLYVGGNYHHIGTPSASRDGVAELDPATGEVSSWNPDPNSTVNSIQVSGSTIYLGGTFTTLNGATESRSRMGAVDSTTGIATTWNPNVTSNYPEDLVLDGTKVYVAGYFTSIGGFTRRYIAAVDTSTGVPTSWNPNANNYVLDLEPFAYGDVIAVGYFTSIGGGSRGHIALLSDTTGLADPWNPNASGPVYAAEVTDKAVFVGGYFSAVGGSRRYGVAGFCRELAPYSLAAYPNGPNSIFVSWTSRGAPLHIVYRSRTSGGPYEKVGETSGTWFVDDTAQGGVTYYYVVRGKDQCESDPTSEVSSSTDGSCSDGPVFDGAAFAANSSSVVCAVDLAWWPADSGCTGTVTYNVYRSTASGFLPGPATLIESNVSTTSFVDTSPLSEGQTYYYVVRAVGDSNGAEDDNLTRQAVTYSCPCQCARSIPELTWQLTSLGCAPAPATVENVFGDDVGTADYGTTWIVIERDEDANTYHGLAVTDPLVHGEGYWFKSLDSAPTLDARGDSASTACPASSQYGECFDIQLVGDIDGRYNMKGFPYSTAVPWAGVRFVDAAETEYSPVEAEVAGLASKTMHQWTGSSYAAYDGVTPGAEGSLPALTGFWVKANQNVTLRMPTAAAVEALRGPGSGGDGRAGNSPGADEWYLRLTVSADQMHDRGNLIGRLADSIDGADSHDLPELAPFAGPYLTVVFPHPEWPGNAWAYTSDYREAREGAGGTWTLEVDSDSARQVTLGWEGVGAHVPDVLSRSRLVNEETNVEIYPSAQSSVTFSTVGQIHRLRWVVNALPLVEVREAFAAVAGEELAVVATFTDEDPADTHTATIDWGDGLVSEAVVDESGGIASGGHVFAAGTYDAAVCVTDSGSAQACARFQVTATDASTVIFDDDFETGDTSAWLS